MPFNATNPFVVGQDLRKSALDRVMDNTIALRDARLTHDLGGSFHSAMADTSLAEIPGAVWVEIDGANLGGLTVEVHAMCKVAVGTGYIRLRNVTAVGEVGTEVAFTSAAPALVKITGLTLAVGLHVYVLRARGSVSNALPTVWGAKLVLR